MKETIRSSSASPPHPRITPSTQPSHNGNMHTPKRRLRRPNDSGAVVPERINRRGAKSQTTNKVPHVEQKTKHRHLFLTSFVAIG
jgi:hypothetical protein